MVFVGLWRLTIVTPLNLMAVIITRLEFEIVLKTISSSKVLLKYPI